MNFENCMDHITDPRDEKNQVYSLGSLVLIVFSAVISGFDTIDTMLEFARRKIDWLRKYVELPRIPSAETIRYFLCTVNPNELTQCFGLFIQSNQIDLADDCIAIDGKSMRGTKKGGNQALHAISAWSNKHGITLAMLESRGKKNEIKTIPEVLDLLEPKDAIITTDAMGCQKDIAAKIKAKKADYVLQLKSNQGKLFEEVKAYHHKLERTGFDGVEVDVFEEIDKGHGRLEVRKYTHFEVSDWVSAAEGWKDLNSIVIAERSRDIKGVVSQETSWYISSLRIDASKAAKATRSHWGVENSLHWRLDVVFNDDACTLHSGYGAINMGIIKRYCMNLLSQDKTVKRMKSKVVAAAVDDLFREKVLFG